MGYKSPLLYQPGGWQYSISFKNPGVQKKFYLMALCIEKVTVHESSRISGEFYLNFEI